MKTGKSNWFLVFLLAGLLSVACGEDLPGFDAGIDAGLDAGEEDAGFDAGQEDAGQDAGEDAGEDAAEDAGVDAGEDASPGPCRTRITYGEAWIRPSGHAADYDLVEEYVSWDGSFQVDAAGSAYATLSNGWVPYFTDRDCVMAFDYSGDCVSAPAGRDSRVTYGQAWLPPDNHPNQYDDVSYVLGWDGVRHAGSGTSWVLLSNGWTPTFSGADNCAMAFRYRQCGGLYANPAVAVNCPDPGVMRAGDTYYMACTSGHYRYPIRSSEDLVHWTSRGTVFTDASHPTWATGNFWAPELHRVGDHYVVYYSAIDGASGTYAIGAGVASDPAGPYADIGHPLLTEPAPGAIDAHHFEDTDGTHYLLWKVDGNAAGASTPIKIQPLAADGLSLTGAPTTLISNTLAWEGALVEGPWMIQRNGTYYLFYSANGYASPSYGVGVARASSPTGPFTKAAEPILTSKGDWAGPGHGSVLRGPSGDWVHVYHAWQAGHVGESPGRLVLVDRIQWADGWPLMRSAPSSRSHPLP